MLGLVALTAVGCSSIPDVEDIVDLDFTPTAPDEREVRVHQVLSMPPDYQLRAPADGSVPIDQDGQANPYALPSVQEGGVMAAQVPPGSTTAPADPAVTAQTQVATADPNEPGPQTIAPGTQTASAQQSENYHGVNPLRPDGTRKSSNEINEELRQRRIEEERRRNPNYGTIFNIGALFED